MRLVRKLLMRYWDGGAAWAVGLGYCAMLWGRPSRPWVVLRKEALLRIPRSQLPTPLQASSVTDGARLPLNQIGALRRALIGRLSCLRCAFLHPPLALIQGRPALQSPEPHVKPTPKTPGHVFETSMAFVIPHDDAPLESSKSPGRAPHLD
jgi:hypothetical protein